MQQLGSVSYGDNQILIQAQDPVRGVVLERADLKIRNIESAQSTCEEYTGAHRGIRLRYRASRLMNYNGLERAVRLSGEECPF
jgi:hypothetical protein